MKRLFALILTLIPALSLCACAGNGNASIETGSEAPSSSITVFSGDTSGSVDGQIYTNAFAELTFTAPDGWIYTDNAGIDMNVGGGSQANIIVSVAIERNYSDTGLEDYLGMISDGLTNNELYKDYGYERVGGFTQTAIGGNTYSVMEFDAKPFGNAAKQYYAARLKEGYMICITISCPASDDFESVLGCFS